LKLESYWVGYLQSTVDITLSVGYKALTGTSLLSYHRPAHVFAEQHNYSRQLNTLHKTVIPSCDM